MRSNPYFLERSHSDSGRSTWGPLRPCPSRYGRFAFAAASGGVLPRLPTMIVFSQRQPYYRMLHGAAGLTARARLLDARSGTGPRPAAFRSPTGSTPRRNRPNFAAGGTAPERRCGPMGLFPGRFPAAMSAICSTFERAATRRGHARLAILGRFAMGVAKTIPNNCSRTWCSNCMTWPGTRHRCGAGHFRHKRAFAKWDEQVLRLRGLAPTSRWQARAELRPRRETATSTTPSPTTSPACLRRHPLKCPVFGGQPLGRNAAPVGMDHDRHGARPHHDARRQPPVPHGRAAGHGCGGGHAAQHGA